jgi:hypothetical protein
VKGNELAQDNNPVVNILTHFPVAYTKVNF